MGQRPNYGEVIDRYDGLRPYRATYYPYASRPRYNICDDPLRMLRRIRFATQLDFDIDPVTFAALRRNAPRIEIITAERIKDELFKIMASPKPSIGWTYLLESGLLALILPELARMKGVEVVKGRAHKDNFYHTMAVLDAVAAASDNVYSALGGLVPRYRQSRRPSISTRARLDVPQPYFIGAKMVKTIFRRMKFPLARR